MTIISQVVAIPAFLRGNGSDLPISESHDSDLRRSLRGDGRTLEDFAPNKHRKPPPMNDIYTERDGEVTTITPASEHEEAVTKAAAYFAIRNREMAEMKAKLESYIVACRERDARIEQLEISLAEERNRSAHMQNQRDDAIGDRAMLEALFASIKVQVDAFQLPQQVIPPRGTDGRHLLEPVANAEPPQAWKDAKAERDAGWPELAETIVAERESEQKQ